jgi:nanoRNase/pAp phosphatase (c-di-AMP/oligoRNAs hydrolase)
MTAFMAAEQKYRLVTRSDFDGLVCAVLLRSLDMIDDIDFVHPKDVQDGAVAITERDILTNLPYAARAHVVFDHHHSEALRAGGAATNHIIDPAAPSAARVVYDYFGGSEAFPQVSGELMRAVDQADSADYSLEEILNPQGWTLLNYLMDSRTGLGRFRDFRISNYQLMMRLIDMVLEHETVEEILNDPDVAERVELYREQSEFFIEQLHRVSTVRGDLVVVDLRDEDVIHAGNRFMIYALYPQCRVSAHVIWGKQKQNTVFAVGKSILDRTSPLDIGALMLSYGGGGHHAAGTCQVPHQDADRVLSEIARAANDYQKTEQSAVR